MSNTPEMSEAFKKWRFTVKEDYEQLMKKKRLTKSDLYYLLLVDVTNMLYELKKQNESK